MPARGFPHPEAIFRVTGKLLFDAIADILSLAGQNRAGEALFPSFILHLSVEITAAITSKRWMPGKQATVA